MSGGDTEELIDRVERALEYRDEEPHEEPLDELAKRRRIDELLAKSETFDPFEAEGENADPEEHPRRWPWFVAAGVALLAAAAVLLQISGEPRVEGRSPVRVTVKEAPLEVRTVLRAEQSVQVVGDGIAIVADRGARLAFTRASSRLVTVALESGSLLAIVEPSDERPELVVSTSAGRVTVTGTVFGVQAEGGTARVEVFRGSVELEAVGAKSRRLASSYAAAIGSDGSEPLDTRRMIRVRDLAEEVSRLARVGDAEALDRIDYGEAFGRAVEQERVASTAVADASVAEVPEPRAVARPIAERRTPKRLLAQAREARRARDWKAAAGLYGDLVRAFPGSAEVGVALISLASLELNKLGRPAQALGRYNEYLSRGGKGNLVVEAHWGRARALRKLGRSAEERTALQRFVARFPRAIQATEARQRLEELGRVR